MLKDKTIFITGSARGIGFGIARAILESGGKVVLSDIEQDALDNAQTTLTSDLSISADRVVAIAADVTDETSIVDAMTNAQDHFGNLDGLVNNAGVIRMSNNIEASADDWRFQMEVNVIGTHNCCNVFAKQLLAKKQAGSIVNIASNAGKVGYPNMAGYNASKAAIINLTRTLSAEWSELNINVNAVCPGGVYTPMLAEVAEVIAKKIGEDPDNLLKTMVPAQLGRHIEPLEIGRVVTFLLSDHALIIRGQSINADGGDTPY